MPEEKKRSSGSKAAESAKLSERDMTLINVLDRLAAQIRHQDALIGDLSDSMQELMSAVKNSEQKQQSRLDGTEHSIEKFGEGFTRYRSDLLKIVNEQDRVGELTEELSKRQIQISEAQERINLILEGLEKRFGAQEKTATTHYDYSLKQGIELPKQVEDINRHVSKLHMDTEKRLIEDHRDINKMVRDLRSDTMHRLLSLDGVEASLKELLIRTEPPEKKKFFIFRFVRFIRLKTSVFFLRIRMRIRARKDPDAMAIIASEKQQKKAARRLARRKLELGLSDELADGLASEPTGGAISTAADASVVDGAASGAAAVDGVAGDDAVANGAASGGVAADDALVDGALTNASPKEDILNNSPN